MKITPMYKYTDTNGNVIVSSKRPEGEYEERFLIAAEERKLITSDGVNQHKSLIVENASGFFEVEDPNPPMDVIEEGAEVNDEVQSSE